MARFGLTRQQLIRGAVNSPWTTNFRHMEGFPKKWLKRTSMRDPRIKSVRPKDRIKYWNVVPGDQIRLLGDKTNTLHEVLSINKVSNRVFVKGTSVVSLSCFCVFFNLILIPLSSLRTMTTRWRATEITIIHGVSCSSATIIYHRHSVPRVWNLKTRRRLAPTSTTLQADRISKVFARRLGTSEPFWNPFLRRFDWQRFATSTVPRLPLSAGERHLIPWPEAPKVQIPERMCLWMPNYHSSAHA